MALFISETYPSLGSESLVTARLVEAFERGGSQVDVYCQGDGGAGAEATSEGSAGTGSAVYRCRRLRSELLRHLAKKVLVEPFGAWGKDLSRHLRQVVWARDVRRTMRRRGREYEVFLSRGYYGHLPALRVPRGRAPWIAHWSDPFPEQRYPCPYGNGPEAAIPFFVLRYLRAVGERADWHVFPCARLRSYMLQYLPEVVAHRSSVVPHVLPAAPTPVRRVDVSVFTMVHTGALHDERDPFAFLQGLAMAKSRLADAASIRMVFVGHIPESFRRIADQLKLGPTVEFIGPIAYAEAHAMAAAADVLVIIEAPLEEGIFLPSKFVNYVVTGRPILCVSPKVGTLNDYITRYGGGMSVDCRDAGLIASAILVLHRVWRSGTLDERFGSHHLAPLFAPSAAVGAYEGILHEIGAGLARASRAAPAE